MRHIEKAWTCINRWERRGYIEQVKTFKEVMAENERFREALRIIRDELGDTPIDSMRAYEISDAALKKTE